MKEIALAASILMLTTMSALAQSWGGGYVGVTAGYGAGQSSQTDTGLPKPLIPTVPVPPAGCVQFSGWGCDGHYNARGALAGGSVGHDWQKGMWVYGAEADLSWAGVNGQSTVCGATSPTPHPCGTTFDTLATFRGRLGVAQGNWLLYATGGVAVGRLYGWDALMPSSGTDWRAGWAAGLGVETAITPHWSVKLEYLHVDLGNGPVFNSGPGLPESVSFRADTIRAGISYHLDGGQFSANPSPKLFTKAVKAPTVRPVDPWSGWYAGLNAGYVDGSTAISSTAQTISASSFAGNTVAMTASATQQLATGRGGFLGGAQVGYNYLISPKWLAGWEADLQDSSLRGRAAGLSNVSTVGGAPNDIASTEISASRSLDYLGTIRARIGGLATPGLLLYGTAGLALGGVRSSTNVNQTVIVGPGQPNATSTTSGAFGTTRAGYTVGAGGEWTFAPNWSAKAEYLYYDLGSASYGTGLTQYDAPSQLSNGVGIDAFATTSHVHFNGNILRAGVNYHFN